MHFTPWHAPFHLARRRETAGTRSRAIRAGGHGARSTASHTGFAWRAAGRTSARASRTSRTRTRHGAGARARATASTRARRWFNTSRHTVGGTGAGIRLALPRCSVGARTRSTAAGAGARTRAGSHGVSAFVVGDSAAAFHHLAHHA